MLGYAEALTDDVVPVSRLPEVGRILRAEAQRLDRFLGDLLDLARLEADDFRLDLAPVDQDLLVREAATSWRERCARHDVVFRGGGPAPRQEQSAAAPMRPASWPRVARRRGGGPGRVRVVWA
ncbi:hypothetical protein [Streptomyces sp. SID2888]|uniref:hypothetical protein n=1 Tax=Streptomyces sp. SID2888 TaxID=2690256 RepID=UPI00192684E0